MAFVQTTPVFEKIRSETLLGLLGAFSFAALTGIGAFLVIPLPFTPIPITAQTLIVLLSGVFLGRKYGPLSQFLYISLGVIGLPWFANGSAGLDVLLGATGGYLVGFVLASYLVGTITDTSEHTRILPIIIYSLTLSTILVYVTGVLGLILVANLDLWTALQLGFFPFLPGDLFKILIATIIASFYLPPGSTKIDTELTSGKEIMLVTTAILSSIFVVGFIGYLLTAGDLPPTQLPLYSTLTALLVIPGIILVYIVRTHK